MAFVSTLSQVKLLLAASYSASVSVNILSVSKYPPLFTSTSVNNCEILAEVGPNGSIFALF